MNKFTRLTALLLAMLMIFSTVATAETAYQVGGMTVENWQGIVDAAEEKLFTIKEGGDPIELPTPTPVDSKPYVNTKEVELSVGSFTMSTADLTIVKSAVAGQWQIAIGETVNDEGEMVTLWANLAGETGATLNVNATMLAGSPDKAIRQVADGSVVGTMTFAMKEPDATMSLDMVAREGEDTVTQPERASDVLSLERANDAKTATITVSYQLADGTSVANNNGGNYPINSIRNDSWANPPVTGYQVGEATVNGTKITLGADSDNDGIAITAAQVSLSSYTLTNDLEIVVIYEPAMVDYKIMYYFEPVDGGKHVENATIKPHKTVENGALTGSIVDAQPEVTLPGFTLLYYDKPEVAADGSTKVNVYYNRLSYLVNLDLAGGYGAEPVYGRYGSSYTIANPKRDGYVFEGWVLETAQDATPVKNLSGTIGTSNIKYIAKWTPANTTYQVAVWAENPNDTDYAFLASYTVAAVTGTTPAQTEAQVKAQLQSVLTTAAYNELQYFTYDATLTTVDNDVDGGIAGDGSTILNVKFKRNVYTLQFVATGICGLDEHTHTARDAVNGCYSLTCGLTEHTHTDDCNPHTNCGLDEHNHGTDGCEMTNCDHLTHLLSCYRTSDAYYYNKLIVTSKPSQITATTNGIHTYTSNRTTHYYLCVDGTWYCAGRNKLFGGTEASDTTEIVMTCSHTHTDACYDCGKTNHEHSESCTEYDCGLTTHQHQTSCYTLVCTKTEHTHGNSCDNEYSDNVVRAITAKYGADIRAYFPIKGTDGTDYTGYRWRVPTGCESFEPGNNILSLDTMPGEDIRFTTPSNGTGTTVYYCIETLDGKGAYNYTYNNVTRNFSQHKKVEMPSSGNLTYLEEFHDIEGFTQWVSNPPFSNYGEGGKVSKQAEHYLYYTRNTYKLKFYNVNSYVDSTGQNQVADTVSVPVKYEAPLAQYEIEEPRYPYAEANAYEFVGWYTTSGCYPGSEVDFDEATMPASDLTIYAKWQPKKHTVNVYMDDTLTVALQAAQKVPHRGYATAPTTPTKENHEFVGWFYEDAAGNEKPFDFSMQVVQDMNIYAKWKTTQVQTFQVRYVYVDDNGNEIAEIADVKNGEGLVGTEVTFEAKTGISLNDGYREGYFPTVQSHSITIDEDANNNVYTFKYIHRDSVPYTVYYIIVDADGKPTGKNAFEPYTNGENGLAAVTEEFKPKPGYVSWDNQYQKMLTVVANGQSTDYNNNNIADYADDPTTDVVEYENVIFFYYYEDLLNSQYIIRHMLQNVDGVAYTEYTPDTINATAANGTVQGDDINDYQNYKYEMAKVILLKDNTEAVPNVDWDNSPNVSYPLPQGGMEILIYYKLDVSTLTITKTVEGGAPTANTDTFDITVTFTPVSGEDMPAALNYTKTNGSVVTEGTVQVADNKAVLTGVKNGDTFVIEGIIIGTQYTVEETQKAVYYADSYENQTGSIPVNGATAAVTNTYQTGSLTISKAVVGTTAPQGDEFTFTVKLSPGSYPYTKGTINDSYDFTDGEETIILKGGGSVTITGIPANTAYTVTETAKAGYTVNYTDGTTTGTIPVNSVAVAEFVNSYLYGDLIIEKKVENAGNQSFIFEVTGPNGYSCMVTIQGAGTVTLADLVPGIYNVKEKTDWSYRFTKTEPDGDGTATVVAGATVKVSFTNTEKDEKWLHDESSVTNTFKPN